MVSSSLHVAPVHPLFRVDAHRWNREIHAIIYLRPHFGPERWGRTPESERHGCQNRSKHAASKNGGDAGQSKDPNKRPLSSSPLTSSPSAGGISPTNMSRFCRSWRVHWFLHLGRSPGHDLFSSTIFSRRTRRGRNGRRRDRSSNWGMTCFFKFHLPRPDGQPNERQYQVATSTQTGLMA